ncbi:MAG: type II toxin-antitoxin system RelE/ParE family toxin [Blastochloris sp.]|nr:type II toxin-antitoxin system RelE/ParE family toxin [Blastochloris sp.]
MRIVLHPTADSELTEAVSYYAEIDPQLGERFYLEMERLISEIAVHPQTFRMFDPPARRHFSLSFPYGIIYLEQEDRIWVVAVMHMKRDPGYWKSRLA